MSKFNLAIIILLISAGITKTQAQTSQNSFNAKQVTGDFKITTFNAEWLSCPNNGPTDEELQINNIVALIKAMKSDIVALQEVGTSSKYASIDTLVRRLGSEWAGSMVANSTDNCGQNEGLVYKKTKVQLLNASFINNAGSFSDWASGRYPVLYNMNMLVDDTTIPVSIINIHPKAMGDVSSYNRRKNASQGLKALLDGNQFSSKRVILLGDFNDYLIGTQCSECTPGDSPYKNFMDDTQNYKCLSSSLYDPSYNSPVIDNIIISNELFDNYKSNSTIREVVASQSISNYKNTTSDHVPVSADFSMAASTPNCESISYSETFASSLGSFTTINVNGSQVWSWELNYGAKISGYASAVNNSNEDWLISPAFDLSGQSSATLTFNHALNFCPTESDILNNQTLWVSTNYNNEAPANATWTKLTITNMPTGKSWAFVSSGDVQLPSQMLQNNVHFAFKYMSNSSVAGTWEIKDIILNSECKPLGISTKIIETQNTVYVLDKKINIRNKQAEVVVVYDITGRTLFSVPTVLNIEIPIGQSGVYLVRTGNEINKVVLR